MRVLDACGLICPLPVLRARKILLSMPAGETLKVLATDPNTAIDLPQFCRERGYEVVLIDRSDARIEITITVS